MVVAVAIVIRRTICLRLGTSSVFLPGISPSVIMPASAPCNGQYKTTDNIVRPLLQRGTQDNVIMPPSAVCNGQYKTTDNIVRQLLQRGTQDNVIMPPSAVCNGQYKTTDNIVRPLLLLSTQYNIQTHKRSKRTLFIRTKYNMRICGVIPFFRLQNKT